MRALLVLLLLVLSALPASPQEMRDGSRPATIGVRMGNERPAPAVRLILAGGPAALAGIRPGDRILAVDGRSTEGRTGRQVERWIEGDRGQPVTLTVASAEGTRTLRMPRKDLYAPGEGWTEAVRTPHFVIHHRADGGSRRYARRLARTAEATVRRELKGVDTQGRRAHLFVVPPMQGDGDVKRRQEALLPWWGVWVPALPSDGDEVAGTLVYLRHGEPGVAAQERLGDRMLWNEPAGEMHRYAVAQLMAMGMDPASPPEVLARLSPDLVGMSASLRMYIRDRWGDRVFGALWRSDLPFTDAVRAELRVDERELFADWRDEIFTLGPQRDAGPGLETFLVTIGWGVVILAFGVWVARGKQAG